MSAGTLTLTNNSAAVSGAGTAFNTELAAGDFIVVTVGGVPYTLPVKSVESSTALTLVSVYTGPTQSGAAWSAVPRVALNMVTAALVAQSAEALRGLNYDKQNWQQVFSGTGTITVRLPDGTTYTGPAWNGITTSLADKADKTALDAYAKKGANADITSISGLTTALSLSQGGTGLTNPFGTAANTFCQGNDSRLMTVANKTGGEISTAVSVVGNITARKKTAQEPSSGVTIQGSALESTHAIAGNTKVTASLVGQYTWGQSNAFASMFVALYNADGSYLRGSEFTFNGGGSATAPGQWVNNSDQRIKTNIQRIAAPLDKMKQLRGVSWDRLDGYAGGLGFIAQDVREVFPDSVYEGQDRKLLDGSVVKGVLGVDTSGVAAALHHEAILALMEQVEELKAKIK